MVAVGFNPRFACSPTRRVAERRVNASLTDFRRRSATQYEFGLVAHRGLKPTATVKPSLRDGPSQLGPSGRSSLLYALAAGRRRCLSRGVRASGYPRQSRRQILHWAGRLQTCARPGIPACNKLRCAPDTCALASRGLTRSATNGHAKGEAGPASQRCPRPARVPARPRLH